MKRCFKHHYFDGRGGSSRRKKNIVVSVTWGRDNGYNWTDSP